MVNGELVVSVMVLVPVFSLNNSNMLRVCLALCEFVSVTIVIDCQLSAIDNWLLILIKHSFIYLENTSLSSCSDTNCPKLATNSVEHGALAAICGLAGCVALLVEPAGLANAGLDKK